jgi:GNAT superfamily N-acetyltransferase
MALGYVRPARPEDAGEIARIQLSTWRTAYRRLLPRHVLAQLDEDWMAQQWREAVLSPPSDRHRLLVAVEQADQSYLVGFLAAGPPDEAALAPEEDPSALGDDVAAITDLLVEPRWGRRGHGSRLLSAAVDFWRQDGFDTAVAWAYEQDKATINFLTSAGWRPDGAARALDVEDLLVPQVRLHVSLPAAEQAPPAGGPVDRPGESGDSVEEGAEPDGEAGALDD